MDRSKTNNSYSVQVEIPESKMSSITDISEIPVLKNQSRPVLGDIADIKPSTTYGEADNLGAMPILSVTANLNNQDLGTASKDVQASHQIDLGTLTARALTVELIGLSHTLTDTMDSLESGLVIAIIVIFLMLAANFQSFKVSGSTGNRSGGNAGLFIIANAVPGQRLTCNRIWG
jgi:multidrug efflux pump subunit AcrB